MRYFSAPTSSFVLFFLYYSVYIIIARRLDTSRNGAPLPIHVYSAWLEKIMALPYSCPIVPLQLRAITGRKCACDSSLITYIVQRRGERQPTAPVQCPGDRSPASTKLLNDRAFLSCQISKILFFGYSLWS